MIHCVVPRAQISMFLGLSKLFSALNRLLVQRGFFEFNKHQEQQEGEVQFGRLQCVLTVSDFRLGTPWTVLHLQTETTLLVVRIHSFAFLSLASRQRGVWRPAAQPVQTEPS